MNKLCELRVVNLFCYLVAAIIIVSPVSHAASMTDFNFKLLQDVKQGDSNEYEQKGSETFHLSSKESCHHGGLIDQSFLDKKSTECNYDPDVSCKLKCNGSVTEMISLTPDKVTLNVKNYWPAVNFTLPNPVITLTLLKPPRI